MKLPPGHWIRRLTLLVKSNFFNLPPSGYLNLWISRLKTDSINIPLKNAIAPQMAHAKVTTWVDDAISGIAKRTSFYGDHA
jgi:hypothetical protein